MITKIPVSCIVYADNSDYLFKEYFNEGKTGLTGEPIVNRELYIQLDNMGVLDCYGIYDNDTLGGFIIASTTPSPHYGGLATNIMSVFVLKEYRKYGTAKKLITLVEQAAKDRGSSIVIISSPEDAVMGKFVPKIGYKVSNILYAKDIR